MAKRVNATAGIERRTIRGGENDAGSANGGANGSGRDDAHADGAGGLIACSRDDRSAGSEPRFGRAPFRNFCTEVGRLVDRGQEAFVEGGGVQHFLRPAAVGDVKEQSAGSVSHVRGALTGEAEANVVLGKQEVANAVPVFGFVLANPKDFRECEVRQGRIAGELDQPLQAKSAGEITALFFRANVTPYERGANDTPFLVKKDCAVHLA